MNVKHETGELRILSDIRIEQTSRPNCVHMDADGPRDRDMAQTSSHLRYKRYRQASGSQREQKDIVLQADTMTKKRTLNV